MFNLIAAGAVTGANYTGTRIAVSINTPRKG